MTEAAARAPFWSDDFDMDLLKIVPNLRQYLGASQNVELFTHGGTSHDRLNHPSCWHSNNGFVAFFGFRDAAKAAFYSTSAPLVSCTFEEAVRDCWPHDYEIIVEGQSVLNGNEFWRDFEPIMASIRGYGPLSKADLENHVNAVTQRIRTAAETLLRVHRQWQARQPR